MELKKIRRLAKEVLGVGKEKVWFDSSQKEKITECITKEDVRALVAERIIKKKRNTGQSKARAKVLRKKKQKGLKKGLGKRSGTFKTRSKKKKAWMKKVRAQRKVLKELRKDGAVKKDAYRKAYSKVTGGYYRGKKHLKQSIEGSK
ncbi:MAG: 50S ribosomal protein L19e [archaeon]